jgi:hypothetical protein
MICSLVVRPIAPTQKILQLFKPSLLEILLAKRLAECHLCKVGLLLLHLQQALLYRILDNEFGGHYGVNLSQAMLFAWC